MEGLRRVRQSQLELRREFAGSRLEEQILSQVFELIVPIIRHGLTEQNQLASTAEVERIDLPFVKGA
jgi:hypothetical protein